MRFPSHIFTLISLITILSAVASPVKRSSNHKTTILKQATRAQIVNRALRVRTTTPKPSPAPPPPLPVFPASTCPGVTSTGTIPYATISDIAFSSINTLIERSGNYNSQEECTEACHKDKSCTIGSAYKASGRKCYKLNSLPQYNIFSFANKDVKITLEDTLCTNPPAALKQFPGYSSRCCVQYRCD